MLLALLPRVLPLLLLLDLVQLLLALPLLHRLLSGTAADSHTPTPQQLQIVIVDARLFLLLWLGCCCFALFVILRGLLLLL